MWLSRLFNSKQESPRLTAIYISVSAGQPVQSMNSVSAIVGKGLDADRYARQKGFYQSVDSCEVTMITQDELDHANRRASSTIAQQLATGGHRRNLVIAGLYIKQLAGKSFVIGEAVFRYRKPRPPCAYIDRVSGKGMCKALGKHSGACIEVVTGGLISVGDGVRVIQ
jgi:MOSC domain-containing protein YiiM